MDVASRYFQMAECVASIGAQFKVQLVMGFVLPNRAVDAYAFCV